MKDVRTRLGGEVDDPAVETAELGGWTVAFDLELLNRVDNRKERHLTRLRLQYRDAVEEVLVRPRAPAVDARKLRIGGEGDPWGERRQRDERAPVQRQLQDLLMPDDGPEACSLASKGRRVARHGHGFREAANGKLEIDADRVAGRDLNTVANQRPKAGDLHAHSVDAWWKSRRGVYAGRARHDRPRDTSLDRRHRDGRVAHDRPGLVAHDAGQRAGARLCERRSKGENRQHLAVDCTIALRR